MSEGKQREGQAGQSHTMHLDQLPSLLLLIITNLKTGLGIPSVGTFLCTAVFILGTS